MSNFGDPAFTANAAFDPNDIMASDHDVFTATITLVSGQNVKRGTLLGKITTGGKYNKSLSAASDGSQVPAAIAANDVDATAGDKNLLVYLAGGFKFNKLIVGSAHTLASVKEALAAKGIFLYNDVDP